MHVITSFGGYGMGGAETMLLKLVEAQLGGDLTFHVVSLSVDGPVGVGLRAAGVETSLLGMDRGVPSPGKALRLRGLIRRFRPDLIQTWMYHADLVGGVMGRLAGVPVIWGLRAGGLDPRTTKRSTFATRRACALLSGLVPRTIVSCSRAVAEEHVALGYDAGKTLVIPNGFDVARFRPSPDARREVRRELGLAEGQPLVGIPARFDPQKDHATFLRAAALLRARRPDVAFLACGDGMTRDNPALMALVEAAGVGPALHLLGRRADMPRIAAALDLVTLSSIGEGFPNVIGEAMACGVPAVVTDAGDAGWLVGDTGRTVPVRDPAALAAAWAELLELAPPDRAALGARARQRVEREFDLRAVARRFEALYRDLLAPPRAVDGRGHLG